MMFSILRWTQLLLAAVLGVANPNTVGHDVNGAAFRPFHADGKAVALFFLSPDCPISKFYAVEIQRLCETYGTHGVTCRLVFEDLFGTRESIRKHVVDFGYRGITATLDETTELARQAGATITPQAVVVGQKGRILYRGRIDNYYADLGKPRQKATTQDLKNALEAVISGRPITVPETQAVGCFIPSPDLIKATPAKGGTQ